MPSLVLGVTLLAVAPLTAHADAPASATASAESQALFAEARALVEEQKYIEACPKFEASLKLEPGVGTRFYLADCYEHIGRLASAWATFSNVEELAQSKAQQEQAHKRAALLAPRLVRVAIDVPEKVRHLPGLAVRRGDLALAPGQFGTAVPIDPGTITISATALSKKRWTMSLDATKEGATLTVQVPMLEDDPEAGAKTPPTDTGTSSSSWSPLRITGATASGAGVLVVALGGVFGALALDKKNASERDGHCDQAASCDGIGLALRNSGRAMGDVSTALFIAGGAVAAGGVVVYLVAPPGQPRQQISQNAAVYIGVGAVGFRGTW